MIETTEEMIIRHEGLRFTPYKCPAGRLTIGIGRNLEDKGITEEEALYLFKNDLDEVERDLSNGIFKGQFYDFPEPVRNALRDMRFQLGANGFRSFKKMITAFKNKDCQEAIVQMKDSKWYGQATKRANELIGLIKEVL